MRHLRLAALLLPALFLLLSTAPAGASLLRALVAEVPDGATLVVMSGNRRLTVVLKGVQAPGDPREAEQARKHLAALAMGREVTVEYTGLRGQSIYGRVMCGAMDLGLQVVRDGAARYYDAPDNALGTAERQLYVESERAARAERRGVWQSAQTTSAGQARLAFSAEVSVAPQSRVRRARPALSTEEALINRIASAPSPAKAPKRSGGSPPEKQTSWPLNTPGENVDFSQYLGQGRMTVVYFYAEWCPACRAATPLMKGINQANGDVEVLALDIADWGSPVASANGINFVPYFQIYDESGGLVAEGKQAARWLAEEAARRAR